MGNNYRLRIVKTGAPVIECAGKVEQNALKLARANGELLYNVPLERVAGLSHPAPKNLRIKLVVNETTVGSLELEEAVVGGPFAPLTALYSELVKALEAMKGKRRHRAGSMDPITMSDYLRKAAASFGARPEPAAFMTVDAQPAKSPASPPARPPAAAQPVMMQNAAFEEAEAPDMFADDDEDDSPAKPSSFQPKSNGVAREVDALRHQTSASQQALEAQAAANRGTITALEQQVATLRRQLQEAEASGHRGQVAGREASRQLDAALAEKSAALGNAQAATKEKEAAQAGLQAANKQLAALREALQAAQKSDAGRASGIESLQAELERCRAQLAEATQERETLRRRAADSAAALAASQEDLVTLNSALEAAQAELAQRSEASQGQLRTLQEAAEQAEAGLKSTHSALVAAQETIAGLEADLATAAQRASNAKLSSSESHQLLQETQDALALAQRQLATANQAHSQDLEELTALRAQTHELQAAVAQAVDEIEAQNEVQAQQQAAMQDLATQATAKDAELARLRGSAVLELQKTESLKQDQAMVVAELEAEVRGLRKELQHAEERASLLAPDGPAAIPEIAARRESVHCLSCLAQQAQVQEANLRADTAVADAVTRLASAEADLRSANRELEQVIMARDALIDQNKELQARTPQASDLQAALEVAERRAMDAEDQARRLQADLRSAQEEATIGFEGQASQRKLMQLQTQLADAEARAAAHFAILQQNQQRKEIQERRNVALKARLEEAQAQSDAALAALEREASGRIAEVMQEAEDRIAEGLRGAESNRVSFQRAQEQTNTLIAELRNANHQLAEENHETKKRALRSSNDLEACQRDMRALETRCRALQTQVMPLRDQAEFDSARCRRLEAEVTTLTKHLQNTTADLLHTQKLLEETELSASGVRRPQMRSLPFFSSLLKKPSLMPQHLELEPGVKVDDLVSDDASRPATKIAAVRNRTKSFLAADLRAAAPYAAERPPTFGTGMDRLGDAELPAARGYAPPRELERSQSRSRGVRLGLASEIKSAGRLLQQLSTKLEAAGVHSRAGSRRPSAAVEGGFLGRGVLA